MRRINFEALVAQNKQELLNDKKELERIYNKVEKKIIKKSS